MQMDRLNKEVAKGSHAKKDVLTLTDNELIKAALDEEEKLARENSKVYGNIIKNRVAAYKKMSVEDWIAHVIASIKPDQQENTSSAPQPIDTGLPMDQEHIVLPHLIIDQTPLAKHGYILTPPTTEEIAEGTPMLRLAHLDLMLWKLTRVSQPKLLLQHLSISRCAIVANHVSELCQIAWKMDP